MKYGIPLIAIISILSLLLTASMIYAQTTAAPQMRHISAALQKKVAETNYKEVKIKEIPVAMQCWTFRRFTFFEALSKVAELGIQNIQAYPGQALDKELPNAKFDHSMNEELMAKIKAKLKEAGVSLVAYGVCDIGETEESMRKVFNFARSMGIKTIVTEPVDDDFTILEKLVKEYDIAIAIHNHPAPSKYNLPETVFDHVKVKDNRIGSCADNGHWMRGMNDPREALKLLEGRILDVHLKDRSGFGTKEVEDVPWGDGKGNIRDLLAELTLQKYNGFITIEYENEKEVSNPVPGILKSLKYVRSLLTSD
jgi:sugar phosphate isomerase/epimerase